MRGSAQLLASWERAPHQKDAPPPFFVPKRCGLKSEGAVV